MHSQHFTLLKPATCFQRNGQQIVFFPWNQFILNASVHFLLKLGFYSIKIQSYLAGRDLKPTI